MEKFKDMLLVLQGRIGVSKFVKIAEEWKNESILMNGGITEYGENICWDVDNYYECVNPTLNISKENKLLNRNELLKGNKYAELRVIESNNQKYFVEVFNILTV